jgi:hypothetical protein
LFGQCGVATTTIFAAGNKKTAGNYVKGERLYLNCRFH